MHRIKDTIWSVERSDNFPEKKEEEMMMNKNLKSKLTYLFSTIFLLCLIFAGDVSAKNNSPEMLCHSYVVMDAGSGKIIFGQDEDKKIYPASTAKLMTAIVCIENGDVNQKIKTKSSIVDNTSPGTYNIGIGAGNTYSFKQLLHMSLMASSADATDTLADAVFGSKKECAKAMRKKCTSLGLKHTSFDNPVGSDIGAGFNDTYATAREMALITRYALSNKLIRNVCAKPYYEIGDMTVSSTNWFLTGQYGYSKNLYKIIGSKSGTTNAAGNVFIATACDKAGHEVICAYFGNVSKESTFKGIRILLDKTFKKYKKGKIKLTKSNYDIRYDKDVKGIYDKLAAKDCLPDHEGDLFKKNASITRSQLATMLRVEKSFEDSQKLKAFEKEDPDGKIRTKDLLDLMKILFPSCISDKASQEEVAAFLSQYKLLNEKAAGEEMHAVTRKEALRFVDKISDYEMIYVSKHPSFGYLKDLGEEKLTDITIFNEKWMKDLKKQK